jgi:DNA invertase Pin-like site-specific DNA recombinase
MGRFIFHIMSALAEMERTNRGAHPGRLAAARERPNRWQASKVNTRTMGPGGPTDCERLDRKQVAIIYDVAVCTLYKKFPASKSA